MDAKELAQFVMDELDKAYGGVKQWSEADAFEGIYAACWNVLEEPKTD